MLHEDKTSMPILYYIILYYIILYYIILYYIILYYIISANCRLVGRPAIKENVTNLDIVFL